ncbi:MAG: hypothetical protein NTV22_06185 [bacterium]|nr:hypothetical protein [bacterium]
MKRIIAVTLAASLVAGLALAEGFPAWSNNTGSLMTKGLQRSIENMVVSPTEVTHWLFKDVNEYSVVGLVIGPVKGTVYAVGRLLGGLGDIPRLAARRRQQLPAVLRQADLPRARCLCDGCSCLPGTAEVSWLAVRFVRGAPSGALLFFIYFAAK